MSLTTNVTSTLGGVQLADVAGMFDGASGDELVAEAATAATPEPTSLLLAAAAAAPLALGRRRRAEVR